MPAMRPLLHHPQPAGFDRIGRDTPQPFAVMEQGEDAEAEREGLAVHQ